MVVNRVCFLLSSLSGGGAEKSIETISGSLENLGMNTILVGVNSGSDPRELGNGITKVSLGRKWRSGPFTWLLALYHLRKLLSLQSINVVVLNGELPESLGIFLSWRIRLLVVEHSGSAWNRFPKLGKYVRAQLRRRKTTWVAVSNNLEIAGVPETEIRRIPNPIPFYPKDQPSRSSRPSPKVEPKLVFLGRLAKEKNPILFLEIARASGMNSRVIGTGPLLKQAMEFGCPGVEFLGFVSDPWEFISSNDLILCTSNFEGDGMAIAETIIRGNPLLIRRFTGYERFRLSERNTFANKDDAIQKIRRHRFDFSELRAPQDITDFERANRNPQVIAKEWQKLLLE